MIKDESIEFLSSKHRNYMQSICQNVQNRAKLIF